MAKSISFNVTLADYREAMRANQTATKRTGWLLMGLVAVVFGALFVLPMLVHVAAPAGAAQPAANDAITSLIPYLGIMVFCVFVIFNALPKNRNRRAYIQLQFRPYKWLQPLMWIVLIGMMLGFATAVAVRGSRHAAPGDDPVGPFMVLVPWAVIAVVVWFLLRRIGKRSYKLQSHLERLKTIEYSADRFSITDELMTGIYKWAAFVRCVESKNLFLLYPSALSFHMVPKRAFASEAEMEEFRDLLRLWENSHSTGFPVVMPQPVQPMSTVEGQLTSTEASTG